MKSKIRKPTPSAWLATALGSRRVGRDSRDFVLVQKLVGTAVEPTPVSRLDCNSPIESFSQVSKKRARGACVEWEARRELDEQATDPGVNWCEA